jgi:subtilisin family serine protease
MAVSNLEETLAAIGYVKVIVTIKEKGAAAAASKAQIETSMRDHFMAPDAAQIESLAAAASRETGRKIKRPEALTSRRVRIYPHLGLAVGSVDSTGLASLQADPQVGKIDKAPEISLIKPVKALAIKTGNGPTWGIKRLGVDKLWDAGFTGQGSLVGHLDTGVDGSHPALAGALHKFAEFDLAGDLVPNAQAHDSGEHGTHTAGTIAGRPVAKGQFGVAPDAQLASAMVIEGGQVVERILGGMDWVIGEGARILSMSLGLRGFTAAFQSVIDALRAANVLPVIAAGNEGAQTSRSPGNYANVLSIGAMDENDNVPDFSSSQTFNRPVNPLCPALVGPGVAITSCVPDNRYEMMDGTSMATPHIAGLAALLLQARPNATADQLEAAIIGSCTLPATMEQARANRGVPDAVKAFELLTGSQLPAADASVARRRRAAPKRGSARKRPSPPRPPGRRVTKSRIAKKMAGRPKAAAARRKKTSVKRRRA